MLSHAALCHPRAALKRKGDLTPTDNRNSRACNWVSVQSDSIQLARTLLTLTPVTYCGLIYPWLLRATPYLTHAIYQTSRQQYVTANPTYPSLQQPIRTGIFNRTYLIHRGNLSSRRHRGAWRPILFNITHTPVVATLEGPRRLLSFLIPWLTLSRRHLVSTGARFLYESPRWHLSFLLPWLRPTPSWRPSYFTNPTAAPHSHLTLNDCRHFGINWRA